MLAEGRGGWIRPGSACRRWRCELKEAESSYRQPNNHYTYLSSILKADQSRSNQEHYHVHSNRPSNLSYPVIPHFLLQVAETAARLTRITEFHVGLWVWRLCELDSLPHEMPYPAILERLNKFLIDTLPYL
ncbi:hypothetical protein AVEN_1431-1 [Araneus ventricosus]|uniref:Uncharacterized protein n=1 Tax=Araneus ventricosus TaxID=182803 RepID=A0A4Y2UU47_ARAVE|nr:hypothetical protein AVEN_1431-1 [Araneus ventricosus]